MTDEISEAQSALQMGSVNFAVFSAANTAAIHLLDSIKSATSLPALKRDGKTIGYHLSTQLSDGCDSKDLWRIGAGPPIAIIKKELNYLEPDILLCPPERSLSEGSLTAKTARKFIKDIHAVIHLHPESGVLMLKPNSNRAITYEYGDIYNEDLKLKKTESCVMRWRRNYLHFGDYRFLLEFVVDGQNKIKAQPNNGYRGLHLSPLLDPTVMKCDPVTSWNIWLHNQIPDTKITSGVNVYTGNPVAVKELEHKAALLPYTRKRLEVACEYHKERDKGILGIIDVWCEHNESPPCMSYRRRERIFYSMPLAKNNFRDMPWAKIKFEQRLALLYQTLVGLAELHQQKIIHGNILPESLLIFTESGHRKAVISLSVRTPKRTPDASVCVAPEVWQSGNDRVLDKIKIDIWALAASWLFAFVVPPKKIKIGKESYGTLKLSLDCQAKNGRINEPLDKLLRQMLAWEPRERPSATDALANGVWKPIADQKQEEKDSRKRKRKETIKGDGKGRRVRVLSPDVDE